MSSVRLDPDKLVALAALENGGHRVAGDRRPLNHPRGQAPLTPATVDAEILEAARQLAHPPGNPPDRAVDGDAGGDEE